MLVLPNFLLLIVASWLRCIARMTGLWFIAFLIGCSIITRIMISYGRRNRGISFILREATSYKKFNGK